MSHSQEATPLILHGLHSLLHVRKYSVPMIIIGIPVQLYSYLSCIHALNYWGCSATIWGARASTAPLPTPKACLITISNSRFLYAA